MIDGKTLCLNMIVKNEMANLDRCLRAVAPHIACWVIGDTGSTDGTQDFIRSFFAARNIPGELHAFPFVNFEQARNAALDCAYASPLTYDYLLLTDADMELIVEDPDFRSKLDAPFYSLLQRSGVSYWNTRIVRRDAGARYRGVTHEYLSVPVSGGQQLAGAWYKDHATGANRVDKFDRDIRLLLEGLREEPENSRYWFYLAQSYRDAGRKEDAVAAYAKRAGMGGWDEEAWYARLQEARCLRDLGENDGFLRQALAAFNQRPHRAEPLYDLARHFRDRGMHEVSVLYSETGLAMRRPEGDTLFVEDFVYETGFKEEYSISANYSRDPARKDRGFAACNWLALARSVPANARGLARYNIRFYVEPAARIMPSLVARRVDFTPPDGWHTTNPSIARQGAALVMIQRTVNYVWTAEGYARTPDDGPVRTRNFLLRLNDNLDTLSSAEILPPADLPPPAFEGVQGFEDERLFDWRGALWCSATVRELSPEGWCQQVLARIEEHGDGSCRLVDWRVLEPAGPRLHEKNWMPLVEGEALRFVYLCDPTRLLDDEARVVAETRPAIAAEEFRGGSQAIPFDGGRLTLIHEVQTEASSKRRAYHHRFVWLDGTGRLARVSRPFFLRQKGVEFAAGLAWHPDGDRLLMSFSMGEREAWIAAVEAGDARALLQDVTRLPWGAPPLAGAKDSGAAGDGAIAAIGSHSRRRDRGAPEFDGRVSPAPPAARKARIIAPSHWSRKFRFHILGIPHTASNSNYLPCAYTQKVVKMCRMLKERGHTVIHYGNEASEVTCDEHVTVTTEDDLAQAYGFEQWKTNMFRFNQNDHAYRTFYRNSIAELAKRKAKNDFLLCMWGGGHRQVADAHGDMIVVEPGIGYPRGHFAKFRVFESYAMFHAHCGVEAVERADRLNAYSVVIPNFFNLDEFEFSAEKDDYFLYLGRVMFGKGVHIVLQVADRIGARVVVAGQGSLADVGYATVPGNVEFVGFAGLERRRKLMSKAKGLFLPSQYIEPFGGVQIESLLSGTPTITTDWGALAENNLHGLTGYRCRTFDHFVWAAKNIGRIDPHVCRRWAEENFSVERIGEMYEEFFQSVMDVFTGKGWYQLHPQRAGLDWLTKYYPDRHD